MKDSVKKIFSFEFWQKFGKCLMVVIAVMPAAGLMISIGKTIPMIDPNAAILVTVGGVIEQIGWGVINNLHLLFALAIGGSWARIVPVVPLLPGCRLFSSTRSRVPYTELRPT